MFPSRMQAGMQRQGMQQPYMQQPMMQPGMHAGMQPGMHQPMMHQHHAGGSSNLPAPVSESYCSPQVAEFIIDQHVFTLSSGKFTIKDPRGELLFQVKGKDPLSLHTKRVVRDAKGNAIVVMRKKLITMHDTWSAYRGKSDSDSDLMYTMSKSNLMQMTPSFDIFMAGNNSGFPDYVVKGDFFSHNYVILRGANTVAQTRKKINLSSVFMGKDQYGVTVFPGVDQAFVASIIVIVDQVKQADDKDAKKQQGNNQGFAVGMY